MRDYADDLAALVQQLELPAVHLPGWSLGGNIAMQYTIDHPGAVRTLTLQATGSPFGFGGSRDIEGTPTWPDYAGSGGGTVNAEFASRLARGDRGNERFSPRTVMNACYFKPPFRVSPEHEELLVSAILSTKVSDDSYSADHVPSANWPGVAPGTRGVNNALSPRYLNQEELVNLAPKPPVLWVHGADDRAVSDTSLFDPGFLGQVGVMPGWPGAQVYPPQPMKAQIRAILARYRAHGAQTQEVLLPDCGHAPHIEKPEDVLRVVSAFVAGCE
ncbi:MAG TPA: alpha/beta hydrolase [Ktedonobacteraceae bacterium]